MPGVRITPEQVAQIVSAWEHVSSGQSAIQAARTTATELGLAKLAIFEQDVFIAGSGPVGSTFARILLHGREPAEQPSVMIAEIGSQEGAIKGRHLKNSLKYQKDIDSFVHVIQGHLQPISVVPNHPVLSMYGNNPNQDRYNNLPASAVTRTVGGMGTHWTCCCPVPHGDEREKSPLKDSELTNLLIEAGTILKVKDNVFNDSIRHRIVRNALDQTLRSRNIGNLPLAVDGPSEKRSYLTWTGPDIILTEEVDKKLTWLTETRVTYLVKGARVNGVTPIRAAVLRDYNMDSDVLVFAKAFVVACGAVSTPQILFRSNIKPPALGHYLSEQTIAFCQIVLKRSNINYAYELAKTDPKVKEKIEKHRKDHPNDVIPIPFDDLEPQVYIPYQENFPWHVQIHRDAFSYGDIGPTADPRIIVDLRFFGRSEIRVENRVYFGTSDDDDSDDSWDEGNTDIYGMPQPTFVFTRSDEDIRRDDCMMEDLKKVAQELGEFLPTAEPRFMPPGLALHITGTTRMGTDKATSVVDVNSKVHNYSNLWLGGCNVIPDSTACNPTRTAVAYAIKAARAVHAHVVTSRR